MLPYGSVLKKDYIVYIILHAGGQLGIFEGRSPLREKKHRVNYVKKIQPSNTV